ncbi:UNVERIFIED_CONTAM: hypothetical protein Slati_0476600 [Sesamum latifolium]|uniref:Uncharacterized protein n=1 Tax=Sesamum latifolium TaxID=2727402 RepID=A0AAW2XWJ7_9LAMI
MEVQIGQLVRIVSGRREGQLPSDTEKNSKEHVNAITLNNGKTLGEEPPKEQVKETPVQREEEPKEEPKGSPLKLNLDTIPPYIPYPKRVLKANLDKQFGKFLEIFKKIHVNIPLIDALSQMPSYAKFLKEVIFNKIKWENGETMKHNEECSAILQNKLPPKLKDPGSFYIPCTIGEINFEKVLCDLGASVNLMPYSIFEKLEMHELTPTIITLQLADRSIKYPRGIVEDVLKMSEEQEEVPSFVDTGQEVKSKFQKVLLLNGSTFNQKAKPPLEVSSDREKINEDKWVRPNRMKRWRNQFDESVGFYKEHTKAWNESHMRKKKFKDGDKQHHKNKGPIKVDWQKLKHYIEGAQPPRLEPPLQLSTN